MLTAPRVLVPSLALLAAGVLLVAFDSEATVRRVEAGGGGDFPTIQGAINASLPGDTVSVGPGRFLERLSIVGKHLVLLGEGATTTVIDAEQQGRVVTIYSTGQPVILEDLGFENGFLGEEGFPENSGGGVGVFTAPLTVRRCSFRKNTVSFSGTGAGLYATIQFVEAGPKPAAEPVLGASLQVFDSVFEENWAGNAGGAVYVNSTDALFSGCAFLRNVAVDGGAVSTLNLSLWVADCVFEENDCTFDGGGIQAVANDNVSLTRVLFEGNQSERRNGGGVYVHAVADVAIEDCWFMNNESAKGGGIYAFSSGLSANRVLWRGNRAEEGAGAFVTEPSSADFERCTWAENAGERGISVFLRMGAAVIRSSLLADAANATRCTQAEISSECNLGVGGPTTSGCATLAGPAEATFCPSDPKALCMALSADCGPVGHSEVSCNDPACLTATAPVSWGDLKSRYR